MSVMDLFSLQEAESREGFEPGADTSVMPLAARMRPRSLDEVAGQRHLLAPGKLLRRAIETDRFTSLIFYGPPGCGKTTLASVIARTTNAHFMMLNGVESNVAEIRERIAQAQMRMSMHGRKTVLFVDELHRFNKAQQDVLLPHLEKGTVRFIGATTENPYFYIYNAILSRSTVFEFKAVEPKEVQIAVERALAIEKGRAALPLRWEEEVPTAIATACGGDVRKSINAVELLCQAAMPRDGELCLTLSDVEQVAQRSAMRYDRGGDAMYDLASALMKSLRGSDPDAALHYLARFLEAGDLVTPCRRLLCSASEDVGMAYPQAISIVKACVDTAMQLGLPEAQLPLAQAAILLATAPKSNSVVEGIGRAWSDVKHGKTGDVPRELQNVHADSTGMEREQGYKYPHSYLGHWVRQQYLPDAIKDARYYEYGDNKTEQAARAYWEKIKNQ